MSTSTKNMTIIDTVYHFLMYCSLKKYFLKHKQVSYLLHGNTLFIYSWRKAHTFNTLYTEIHSMPTPSCMWKMFTFIIKLNILELSYFDTLVSLTYKTKVVLLLSTICTQELQKDKRNNAKENCMKNNKYITQIKIC